MKTEIIVRQFDNAADHAQVAALWKTVFGYAAPHNEPGLAMRKKAAANDGHRGWIYSLAVLPDLRGKGIGRALMRHAESALAALGCLKLNLQVVEGNEATVDFYRNIGYKVEKRVSMGKIL